MKNFATAIIISLITAIGIPAVAMAHVVVTPNQASVGDELIFSASVPNEKDVAMSSVKVDIPAGVEEVTPTAVPGWTISTTGSRDDVSSITWTGNLAVGQRSDFSFGAQVPAKATQLDWKAYQTYADGSVVHWDQKPTGDDDAHGNAGPYSVTKVANDLTASSTAAASSDSSGTAKAALVVGIIAVVLAAGSILIRPKR